MPGYVIHMAIAQEYLRKNSKPYSKEFIKGSIAPDLTDKKSLTHYGKTPIYTSLGKFIEEHDIHSEFDKGFFLHLIADFLFYNYYLQKISKPEIYNDYDITNKYLIERYKVKVLDEVKDVIAFKTGKTKIFDINLACKAIDEISNLSLEEVMKEVKNKEKKWFTYRN